MHCVSLPTHEYARLARAYLEKGKNAPGPDVLSLALTTRAYTKVVLRLRAQAEAEAKVIARLREEHGRACNACQQRGRSEHAGGGGGVSSRSSSPSTSSSHHHRDHHKKTHTRQGSSSTSTSASSCTCRHLRLKFRSPLFRPNRAALLRVFVPSPDGTWLSTSSVEECEAELRRSGTGVAKLLRVGDVVWDVALGDEGNVGRMVWDGGYLVVRLSLAFQDTDGVADMDTVTGSRLQVLAPGRAVSLLPQSRVLAVVLPPRDQDRRQRGTQPAGEPDRIRRREPMGQGDFGKPAAVAGERQGRDVSI